MVQGTTDAEPTGTSPAPNEAVREAVTMVLYVCIVLAAEFVPRMGPWYRRLGRGEGARVVDDTPWVARGHSRETTFQQDLTEPADCASLRAKLVIERMQRGYVNLEQALSDAQAAAAAARPLAARALGRTEGRT